MKLHELASDTAKEKDGIDLDFGDFKFTIARAGGANQRYRRILAAKFKPFQRQIQNDTLSDEKAEQILAETYAEAVILGWSGITDDEGKEIPFTKENCVKFLLDERFHDIVETIRREADRAANFRVSQMTEDAENLEKNSSGRSSGAAKKSS